MSIKGQSFTGAFSGGAHMDFGVGTAGAANVFASDYTIAVLAKTINSGWGLFGGYTDTSAATPVREFFLSDVSGARLFGDGDFTSGFPAAGADADGINDGVWRWHVMSKATGSAHYKFNYADLATLTWVDGESASSANHSDNATAAGMFSTWAIYSQGFDSGDIAAIVVWPTQLSTSDIHTSCTFQAADFKNVSAPIAGWLLKQSAVIAGTIVDFTGGGADEISRPNITNSADPAGFNFNLHEHAIWSTTEAPAGSHTDGGGNGITTATGFIVGAGGAVTGVQFYVPATTQGSHQIIVGLWQFTAPNLQSGTLLASKDGGTGWDLHVNTWQTINFDNPVFVDHTHAYVAGYWHSGGYYTSTTSAWGTHRGTLNTIYAWAQNEDISSVVPSYTSVKNGLFLDNSVFGLPDNNVSPNSYFAGPVWNDNPSSHVALTDADFTITAKALTPVPQAVHQALTLAPLTIAPKVLTAVPGVVHVSLGRAPMALHASLVGDIQVSTSVQIIYNVDVPVSKTYQIIYGVRASVSRSTQLIYAIRAFMAQARVVKLIYDVRKAVSKSYNVVYGIRVPIAAPKSTQLVYAVRSRVSEPVQIEYDVAVQGNGTVTKSVQVIYATMVTPTVDEIIVRPASVDTSPSEIVTTSF